jgi:NADPH:quinone reductase-like Zn-dependent oxidoreductase
VVDYTREDFTRGDRRYDVMLDVAGGRSWSACRRVLTPKAALVIVGGPMGNALLGPLSHIVKMRFGAVRRSQKVVFFVAKFNKTDLGFLRELVEAGKITPVVERRYDLSEIADALRYMGEGHVQGKIVLTVPTTGLD